MLQRLRPSRRSIANIERAPRDADRLWRVILSWSPSIHFSARAPITMIAQREQARLNERWLPGSSVSRRPLPILVRQSRRRNVHEPDAAMRPPAEASCLARQPAVRWRNAVPMHVHWQTQEIRNPEGRVSSWAETKTAVVGDRVAAACSSCAPVERQRRRALRAPDIRGTLLTFAG